MRVVLENDRCCSHWLIPLSREPSQYRESGPRCCKPREIHAWKAHGKTWNPSSAVVFSCDQAALWMVQSVRLSVCPSVCHTFLTMFPSSYHHEIFRSYYQWQKWRPCKKARSEVVITVDKLRFISWNRWLVNVEMCVTGYVWCPCLYSWCVYSGPTANRVRVGVTVVW